MTLFYVVQHGEKKRLPGDPGLTEVGRGQAARTARWLSQAGVTAVFSSPLRRARETADVIASVVGVPVREDGRLRERMNWDGDRPFEDFMADWAACDRDRHLVPRSGDSSWQAGEVDLLRTLAGDRGLAPRLLTEGVLPCAITTLEGLRVLDIASVSHLG